MKRIVAIPYPAKPAMLIRAMTDRQFHVDKIKALGALRSEVLAHAFDGEAFSIRVRRTMRNEAPVPAVLKKLIPAETTLEHHDRWSVQARTAQVDIRLEGIPVALSCRIAITAHGAGSLLTHHWDIRSSLPLIGGALEKFIAADLDRLMAAEAQASAPLLARYT